MLTARHTAPGSEAEPAPPPSPDRAGAPRAVLRSAELRIGPLEGVDDAFAWDEGEGEPTCEDWLRGHRRYFARTCAARGEVFSEEQEVVFVRVRVVWLPEVAA